MPTADREKFKDIFEAALDLPAPERAAFLDSSFAGQAGLREELERLLAADEAAGGFLETSPFDPPVETLPDIPALNYLGRKIGSCLIERELGTGGMGTVFLAARELGDLVQPVAVKIVHQGALSKEIVRRFLIERKILAGLDYSGIARLIDAGETREGLPFLVMEYVAGVPLDEYCRTLDLSLEDRLRLFRQVCAAVAYAHRRLIIHRDLKPSNVLVTAAGEAKLLDFGIAKLLSPSETGAAQTATLMNLLTPAYAAPEQIRGEAVTTATDVYGLGVILYELLTGVRPFSFDLQNYQEIVRIVCETEPPKPSEAQTLQNKNAATGENGDVSTARPASAVFKNRKALRGDLDNIILKALRKDPERRYQAVEQFSEDVERYLKGLPVSARPDTFSYRAAKFVERNLVAVVSFAIICLLLVAGICGTAWQALRAARQQKIAEQRFAQVRELANNVIFKYHDSIANLNGSTEVRKMLVEDATRYLDQLSADAEADADLRNELALAYAKLADVQGKPYAANTGDTAGALGNYRKAVKLLENLSRSPDTAQAARAADEIIPVYHSYSSLCARVFDFDEAVASQQKALELAQTALAAAPADLPKQNTFTRATLWLGDAYAEAGNFPIAVDHYGQAADLAENVYRAAPDDPAAATILGVAHDRLGRSLLLRGRELERTDYPPGRIAGIFQESLAHLEKAAALFQQVAAADPASQKYLRNNIDGQTNLASVLRHTGSLKRSLEILQEVSANTKKVLENDANNRELQFDYAGYIYQAALAEIDRQDFQKGSAEFQQALQMMSKLIAEDSGNMQFRRTELEMTDDYGVMFTKKNDFKGALKIYQPALERLSHDENLSDQTFAAYARGKMDEDLGDCYLGLAGQKAISPNEKAADLKTAADFYQKAAAEWQPPAVRRSYFSRTPETLEYLSEKLARLLNGNADFSPRE